MLMTPVSLIKMLSHVFVAIDREIVQQYVKDYLSDLNTNGQCLVLSRQLLEYFSHAEYLDSMIES
jgi:hypothetical protein